MFPSRWCTMHLKHTSMWLKNSKKHTKRSWKRENGKLAIDRWGIKISNSGKHKLGICFGFSSIILYNLLKILFSLNFSQIYQFFLIFSQIYPKLPPASAPVWAPMDWMNWKKISSKKLYFVQLFLLEMPYLVLKWFRDTVLVAMYLLSRAVFNACSKFIVLLLLNLQLSKTARLTGRMHPHPN